MSSLHVSSSLYDIGSLRDKISRPRPFDKNGYKRVAEELTRKDIFMPTVAPQHSIRNRRLSNQRGINGNKANNSLSGHIHPGRNAYSRQQTMCKNSINGFKGKQNPFQNEGTTKRPDFSCTEAHSKKMGRTQSCILHVQTRFIKNAKSVSTHTYLPGSKK